MKPPCRRLSAKRTAELWHTGQAEGTEEPYSGERVVQEVAEIIGGMMFGGAATTGAPSSAP
jgi:hypothetical protein